MDSILDKLNKDGPLFHNHWRGGLISWNSNMNLLQAMEGCLKPGLRTMEIGSGFSTIVFAHTECVHTCITPVQEEVDRIKNYCGASGISLEKTDFLVGESFSFLPSFAAGGFDFIFIDGAHRFPFPIVDWFFCAILLKDSGLVVINDTDIISGHILLRFMLNDHHWEAVDVRENFGIFKKLRGHDYPDDWKGQPFGMHKIDGPVDLLDAFYPKDRRILSAAVSPSRKDSLKETPRKSLTNAAQLLPMNVVICTYNRAAYLARTLLSLEAQTLDRRDFEVVVIDDGSSDTTRAVAESFRERLPLRYFFQKNAGLASAKNHGIYVSRGWILFFMDDDDIAMPTLLEEHLETHQHYPEENYSVLNYTTWADDIPLLPLMHFVTEIGCFMFSYPHIKHGQILDYTYFWGGRSSCKRSFLIEHGVFDSVFRFGCEDIELGFRLSPYGLKVVYNTRAVSKMIRVVTFDDFCKRLMKQGRSQYVFSQLHDDPRVHQWAEIPGSEAAWAAIRPVFDAKLASARSLDEIAAKRLELKLDLDQLTRRLLYEAYWWAFRACKIKGIAEAREEMQKEEVQEKGASKKTICSSSPCIRKRQ